MKLNRRNVLVAATAFAAGYGQPNTPTASAAERTLTADDKCATDTHVAAIAAECAAACNACLDTCIQQLASGTDQAVRLITQLRDCSDICTVTATQLAGNQSVAMALRQACADACSRLVAAGQDFHAINTVQQCTAAAVSCAAACRRSIA